MNKKHLLSVADLEPEEIYQLLQTALQFKNGLIQVNLKDKSIALIFEKPSLRTRVSFDIAINQLGGHSVYLSKDEVGMGVREPISDVAKVLSRLVDGVVVRTFSQSTLKELSANSSIPVINALSDEEHPCQALADILTIYEKFGDLSGKKIVYIGDGNNVASSLAIAAASLGANVVIAAPSGYSLPNHIIETVRIRALLSKANLLLTDNPAEAASDADVIYTDVWTSMGQEEETETRLEDFKSFQVNQELLSLSKTSALFMHPLPAHPGQEISTGLLENPKSVVFDQAENRLHIQKAILAKLIS